MAAIKFLVLIVWLLNFFNFFFLPQFRNVLSSLEIKRKNIVTFYENGYLYCNKKEGDKRFLKTWRPISYSIKCCLQNYCKNDVKWTGACFTKYIFWWTDILYCWKRYCRDVSKYERYDRYRWNERLHFENYLIEFVMKISYRC